MQHIRSLASNPRQLLRKLFIGKTTNGFVQFFRYGFVGGFSAVVDIGLFHICNSVWDINIQLSIAIAFLVATVVNYALSILWIFDSTKNKKVEFSLFTLIGGGGLLLNELIVTLLVHFLHLHPTVGKIISVSIVMIWSFTLRKLLFARTNRMSGNKS